MPYFQFIFSVRDGTSRLSTEWMDEHVLGKVTLQDYVYFSCDEVTLGIMPVAGGICDSAELSTNGGPYSLGEAATLERHGADASDLDPDRDIPWRTISDLGTADDVVWAESGPWDGYPTGWYVIGVQYTWDVSWPENYWFVNYLRDDRLRRTVAIFTDAGGHHHRYYAVPWAFRV